VEIMSRSLLPGPMTMRKPKPRILRFGMPWTFPSQVAEHSIRFRRH
jgi:hypothetical protein